MLSQTEAVAVTERRIDGPYQSLRHPPIPPKTSSSHQRLPFTSYN